MTKVFLAFSISLMVFAASANDELKGYREYSYWVPLGSDGVAADYYVDLNSVKITGYKKHLVTAWIMWGRLPTNLQKKLENTSSIKEHLLIDCNNYKVWSRYTVYYEGIMGEGDIALSFSSVEEWVIAQRGSLYNGALELVCKVVEEKKK